MAIQAIENNNTLTTTIMMIRTMTVIPTRTATMAVDIPSKGIIKVVMTITEEDMEEVVQDISRRKIDDALAPTTLTTIIVIHLTHLVDIHPSEGAEGITMAWMDHLSSDVVITPRILVEVSMDWMGCADLDSDSRKSSLNPQPTCPRLNISA